MADLVWAPDSKPDRPGIWASRCANGESLIREITESSLGHWSFGTWCFICDLPDIKDPPRYRDVCQGDVGRVVEMRMSLDDSWRPVELAAVLRSGASWPYVGIYGADSSVGVFKFARILDDGQPKREAREIWVPCYSHGRSCLAYDTCEEARKAQGEDWTPVRFREVIE